MNGMQESDASPGPRMVQIMLDAAGLERLGDKIREVLPNAEFQLENGDFVLTITVVENQPGEWIAEYPGRSR